MYKKTHHDIYPILPSFAKTALMTWRQYQEGYQQSCDDPETFWGEQAKKYLTWFASWEKVHEIDQKTTSLIDATNEGIKRTAGIITDLWKFAQADEAEMVKTDLHQNIDSTLNLLSSEIKSNIQIIKEYDHLLPPIFCHPGKINQVIMNILINAFHELQSRPNSKILIKTSKKNGSVVLSIKDNGSGIKKEILDKIFIPFFTTKKDGLGSGLGLFISNNIIKEHNGTISVMSELEKGTEFIITLPIKEA